MSFFFFSICLFFCFVEAGCFADFVVVAERPGLWDNFRGHLMDHLDEVNASLSRLGMATLQPQPPTPPASPPGTIVPEEDSVLPAPEEIVGVE